MSRFICYDSDCKNDNKVINKDNFQLHQGHTAITLQELKLILKHEQHEEFARNNIRQSLFSSATLILAQLIANVNEMKKNLQSIEQQFGTQNELSQIVSLIQQCEVSEEKEISQLLSQQISYKFKSQNNKLIWENKTSQDRNVEILTFVCSMILKSLSFQQFKSIDECPKIFSDELKQNLVQMKKTLEDIVDQFVNEKMIQIGSNINCQFESQIHWQPKITLKAHTQPISAIAYNRKQQLLASGSYDTTITIWDCKSKIEKITILHGHKEKICCLDFSEEKNLLASSGYDKDIYLWDIDKLQSQPTVLQGHQSCVNRVKFRQDQLLVSVSNDEKIIIWSLITKQQLKVLCEHQGSINCVAFSLSFPFFGTSGQDMKVVIWEFSNFTKVKELQFKHECLCIEFNDLNQERQLIASGYHFIEVWDYMKNIKLSSFQYITNSICSLSYSPLKQLVLVSTETAILILDSGLTQIHQQFINQACSFNQILLTPDSYQLIYGDKNGNLYVKLSTKEFLE